MLTSITILISFALSVVICDLFTLLNQRCENSRRRDFHPKDLVFDDISDNFRLRYKTKDRSLIPINAYETELFVCGERQELTYMVKCGRGQDEYLMNLFDENKKCWDQLCCYNVSSSEDDNILITGVYIKDSNCYPIKVEHRLYGELFDLLLWANYQVISYNYLLVYSIIHYFYISSKVDGFCLY